MKKNYIFIALILLITFKINAQTTLTQTTNNTITSGTVACTQSEIARDNIYYRAFDLNALGYASMAVTGVEFAVQNVADESAGFAVDAIIYGTNSFPSGALTELAVVSVPLTAMDTNTLKTVAISANVIASTHSILVFSIRVPDEFTNGQDTKFSMGSNSDGQTAESYLSSNACSITQPTTLTAVGFPNTHCVMNVVGNPSLGVEDVTFNPNRIKLHPNPASEFISISGLKNTEDYTIYNYLGAKILEGRIKIDHQIDIKNLNSGLYFFQFKNGNTLKFIKN